MITYLLTSAIFVIFFVALLTRTSKTKSPDFFSKDYTTICKALACLVVVYVHVPPMFSNPVQNAVSSFGYVGVTCFFMISAYGMQFCIDNKNGYIVSFWRNRLSALLIPSLLVNVAGVVLTFILTRMFALQSLVSIHNYVKVLLVYCLLFYVICKLSKRINFVRRNAEWILIFAVLASSLYDYFNNLGMANSAAVFWPYERMGLVWGILLYKFRNQIEQFFKFHRIKKIVLFLVISVVLGVSYLMFKHCVFWGEYLLKIVLGFVILFFALITTYGLTFKSAFCRLIGNISFEIYLAHGMVMKTIQTLCGDLSSGLFIFLAILFTIVLALILNTIAKPLVKACRK